MTLRRTATPDPATDRRLEVVRSWLERKTGRPVPLTAVLNAALKDFARRYCPTGRVRRRAELLEIFKEVGQ
jgi:hypothetical protein